MCQSEVFAFPRLGFRWDLCDILLGIARNGGEHVGPKYKSGWRKLDGSFPRTPFGTRFRVADQPPGTAKSAFSCDGHYMGTGNVAVSGCGRLESSRYAQSQLMRSAMAL